MQTLVLTGAYDIPTSASGYLVRTGVSPIGVKTYLMTKMDLHSGLCTKIENYDHPEHKNHEIRWFKPTLFCNYFHFLLCF